MSGDRYAALELATGVSLVKAQGIWWRRVRRFFYRPLLPLKKYDAEVVRETAGQLNAFQHRVAEGLHHNSYLNPIVYDELQSYDPKNLRRSVRQHIKKALTNGVTVSRIVDKENFIEKAYPVYLSFYERTKYGFDTGRRKKEGFARWVRTLFQFPKVVILGAFVGKELVSFEITCLVENTLILKTSVHADKALTLGVRDLILHHYRISASKQPSIHEIYDGFLGHKQGINEFKIVRGAKVLALPAYLHARPIALWLLKRAKPNAYSRLSGLDPHGLREAKLAS